MRTGYDNERACIFSSFAFVEQKNVGSIEAVSHDEFTLPVYRTIITRFLWKLVYTVTGENYFKWKTLYTISFELFIFTKTNLTGSDNLFKVNISSISSMTL